jgi:putative ABC transport system ATP-binding protein
MIEFKNMVLKIHEQTLLDGVSLRVESGDNLVIRGASGCGKSSLLKCAVGAISIAEGSIHIDGMELSANSVHDIRARIAYIGQEPVLGAENVRDALLLPFSFKAHRESPPSDARVFQCLEQMHLQADILDKPCKRISGGEKQRIAIIRALLLNKTIFLADEVTSALDPESREAVMDELFRPELTLLSVSHDPEWIRRCERIISIDNQQLSEAGHVD